jgi:hypothetical protein
MSRHCDDSAQQDWPKSSHTAFETIDQALNMRHLIVIWIAGPLSARGVPSARSAAIVAKARSRWLVNCGSEAAVSAKQFTFNCLFIVDFIDKLAARWAGSVRQDAHIVLALPGRFVRNSGAA